MKVIKYIPHNEINFGAWDTCIQSAANHLIYGYSWYLDLVSPNWDALVLGNYEAVMPLTHQKKLTFSYLRQPFFTQQLGVFYSNMEFMHSTNDFLAAIPEKYKLIEINLNSSNVPSSKLFTISANTTCHLELYANYEQLSQNYSSQIQRNIRTAQKCNITVDNNIPLETIIKLFKESKGKQIKHFKSKHYELLINLGNALQLYKAVTYMGAKNEKGEYIAGCVWVVHNDMAIFLFSGTNQEAKKSGAMSAIVDEFIKQHAHSHILLDFEGSNDTNLARFYTGFGAKPINYFSLRRNNLPAMVRWIKA